MQEKNNEVTILDIQIIASILYIASISLSIILTYNDKQIAKKEKTILTNTQAANLSVFNRGFIVILTLIFLLLIKIDLFESKFFAFFLFGSIYFRIYSSSVLSSFTIYIKSPICIIHYNLNFGNTIGKDYLFLEQLNIFLQQFLQLHIKR